MSRLVGTVAIAVATTLCACSQKEAATTDTTKIAQAGAPGTPAANNASLGSFDPATHTAVIHAKDFAFDAPDSITAGWTTFHLVNDGPNLHHVQIVRLDSGKTAADFGAAMQAAAKSHAPPPSWMVFAGGPNAPSPKAEAEATVDMQPGNYVLICMVDIPDHVPHFAKGMIHPLKVTAATGSAAAEPTADATVSLADYSFTTQGSLTAGKHTIKVVNKGPQPHELELVRLAPGKTIKDANEFMDKAYAGKADGPPPFDALGGIASEIPGMSEYFTADLTPGNYAFLCFVPDAKDGKAHLEHGMIKEFKVN
jgi:uncharacterized cupredoxin-like copper-binding protein